MKLSGSREGEQQFDTAIGLAGTQALGFVRRGNLNEARQTDAPNVVRFALNAVFDIQ